VPSAVVKTVAALEAEVVLELEEEVVSAAEAVAEGRS